MSDIQHSEPDSWVSVFPPISMPITCSSHLLNSPPSYFIFVQAYSPFELKKGRMLEKKNFRRNKTPRMGPGAEEALRTDVIQHFGIVPQHEHINPLFLNGFLTDMGKIKGRNETRLSRKSQRMIGKAIRRARAIGTMPVMHKALTYTFETTSLSRPDSTTFVWMSFVRSFIRS